jgi:hypothetical protein
MILSIDNHPGGVQLQAMYRPSSSSDKPAATLSKAEMKRARQMEGRAANLKRRIATMNHLIAECDRIVADLDRETRIEEARTKIHDPAHSAFATSTGFAGHAGHIESSKLTFHPDHPMKAGQQSRSLSWRLTLSSGCLHGLSIQS